MQKDILFDNIYIGHSVEDAAKFKAETFDIKNPIEKKEDDATKPETPQKPKSPMDLKFMEDPIHYIKEKVDLFVTIAKSDPIQAAKFVPEVASILALGLAAIIATLIGVVTMSSSSPQVKQAAEKVREATADAKDKMVEAKDKVVEAAASGTEKVQAEVQKRTTRSSAAQQQQE